jgi:hypothetical protein
VNDTNQTGRGYYFLLGFWTAGLISVLLVNCLAHDVAEYHRVLGYKQGQIDALSGKIRYRPALRVEWEEAKP